ncbi:MAG: hypothetical protein MHM6MM_003787 [Cercozoa sp. M6MM]
MQSHLRRFVQRRAFSIEAEQAATSQVPPGGKPRWAGPLVFWVFVGVVVGMYANFETMFPSFVYQLEVGKLEYERQREHQEELERIERLLEQKRAQLAQANAKKSTVDAPEAATPE